MNHLTAILFLVHLTASVCCLGEDTPYQRELLAANVPIRWDGLVLDQDGKPMQGIMVTGTADAFARSLADATGIKETERALTGTSDAQGRVTLDGLQGYRLRLAIRKEGYTDWETVLIYNAPGRITEADGLYTGTPGNPLVVNLWKRGPAVPLFELKRHKIIPPNVPMSLFLLTGRIAPWQEGDGASLVMTAVPAEVTVGSGEFQRKENVIAKLFVRSDAGRLRSIPFRMARQVFGLPDRMLVEGGRPSCGSAPTQRISASTCSLVRSMARCMRNWRSRRSGASSRRPVPWG